MTCINCTNIKSALISEIFTTSTGESRISESSTHRPHRQFQAFMVVVKLSLIQ